MFYCDITVVLTTQGGNDYSLFINNRVKGISVVNPNDTKNKLKEIINSK